ncbi:MAG: GYDIA family GHMP kinase [Bacteroidales bacterium]
MEPLYAHGKLLLSAEYLVLHGAKALAVPLRMGQSLKRFRSGKQGIFSWKAFYRDALWFSAILDPIHLKVISSSDPPSAENLCRILRACVELMPSFQEDLFRWDVETHLDFSPQWGFGSSSTLTALLSEWAEVNPLDLHFMISEGSGYDVACAIAEGPILYRLREDGPHYQHIRFQPPFADQLYFAWLGNKQSTASHLRQKLTGLRPDFETLHRFTVLTDQMVGAQELGPFRIAMEEHEEILSGLLGMERVAGRRFPGLAGSVKSLGAWGGDFVMIASPLPEEELYSYLYQNKIDVIFRFRDLVYEKNDL